MLVFIKCPIARATTARELIRAGFISIMHLEVSNEKKTEVREVAGTRYSWNLDVEGRTILDKP